MAHEFQNPNLSQVSSAIMRAAGRRLARLNRLGLDVAGDPAAEGDTVKVAIASASKPTQFDRQTNNYATGGGKTKFADVVLNNHPLSPVTITPQMIAAIGETKTENIKDVQIDEAARQIADSALEAWHGVLPAADAETSPQFTVTGLSDGIDVTRKDVAKIRKAAVKGVAAASGRPAFAGVSPSMCALVLNSAMFSSALSVFEVAAWTGRSGFVENPVVDGWFPGGLVGFAECVEDPLLGDDVLGYVLPFNSFAIGARHVLVNNKEGVYTEWAYLRDEETRLPITFRVLGVGATDDRILNTEALFGGTLALPAQVLTLLPAA